MDGLTVTCEPTLTARQARLVRELARTPGRPVHWTILADAIGLDIETDPFPRHRVMFVVRSVRRKFGAGIIRADLRAPNEKRGYYLPADWSER